MDGAQADLSPAFLSHYQGLWLPGLPPVPSLAVRSNKSWLIPDRGIRWPQSYHPRCLVISTFLFGPVNHSVPPPPHPLKSPGASSHPLTMLQQYPPPLYILHNPDGAPATPIPILSNPQWNCCSAVHAHAHSGLRKL